MRSAGWIVVAAIAVAIGGGVTANQIEARQREMQRVHALTGGDPRAGKVALQQGPCKGCHQIPGVPGATGRVGPPLTGFSGRAYIAGRLANTPDHLVAWIVDPQAIDPRTAMPRTGVSPSQARDIAAYLYTLK
jgi:cytochrome c2